MISGSGSHGASGDGRAEVIRPPLLEGRDPRDLATQIEAVVEQRPRLRGVHHLGAVAGEGLGRGDVLHAHHPTVAQPDRALQEHARVHVARNAAAPRGRRDVVERVQQGAHVVPVPVRDGDGLHVGEGQPEIPAVPHEQRPLGPGVEQQGVPARAAVRGQDEGQTELRAAERRARQLRGAGLHDVVELGRDVRGLAGVVVAEIVEGDIDHESVDGLQWRHGPGLPEASVAGPRRGTSVRERAATCITASPRCAATAL